MNTLWELFLAAVPWIVFGLWLYHLIRDNLRMRGQMFALSRLVDDCADLCSSLVETARLQEQRLSNVERAVVGDAVRGNYPLPEPIVQRATPDITFQVHQETIFGRRLHPSVLPELSAEDRDRIMSRLREASRPVPMPPEPTTVEKGGVPRPSLTGRRNIKL